MKIVNDVGRPSGRRIRETGSNHLIQAGSSNPPYLILILILISPQQPVPPYQQKTPGLVPQGFPIFYILSAIYSRLRRVRRSTLCSNGKTAKSLGRPAARLERRMERNGSTRTL